VDGNYTGKTPMNISKVAVGNYSIKLTKSGYEDVTTRIRVSAGITTSVSESLSISFWIKVIIAVIAIVIVIVAFFERKRLICGLQKAGPVPRWAVYILTIAALLSIIIASITLLKLIF